MSSKTKTIRTTDAEYNRLLKDAAEIEDLILAAQKSCKKVEQTRRQNSIQPYYKIDIRLRPKTKFKFSTKKKKDSRISGY